MSRVLELAIVLVFAAVVPASAVTVYNVDRFDDDASKTACTVAVNDCTLRGAIIASNANPSADVINLPAGTYTLSLSGAGEDHAATGD